MAINLERMAQKKSESQSGEFWKPDEGDTLAYVMPPCREDDEWEPTAGLNYVPLVVHYGVGDNKMVVCLDCKKNPIMLHPFVIQALAERGIEISEEDGCPVCHAIESREIPTEQVARVKGKTQYMWNIVPLEFKGRKSKDFSALTPQPVVYIAGKQVYDGLMECFNDNGDITDQDAAILAKITREGKDQQTKYKVQCDVKTIKKPLSLDEGLRTQIANAMLPGEGCDLFKVAANLTKSRGDVVEIMSGSKVEVEEDDAETPAAPPPKPVAKPAAVAKPTAKPVAPAAKPAPVSAAKPAPVAAAKPVVAAKPVAKPAPKPAPKPVEEEAAEETPDEEAAPVEEEVVEAAAEGDADDAGLDDLEAELQASIAAKKNTAAKKGK